MACRWAEAFQEGCDGLERLDNGQSVDVDSGMVISDVDTPVVNLMAQHRYEISFVEDRVKLTSESSHLVQVPSPCASHTSRT